MKMTNIIKCGPVLEVTFATRNYNMIKNTFSALFVSALFSSLGAQTVITDTVSMGAGYANSNYYNVVSGSEHTSPINKWHIAHTTSTRDNCIRLNHTAGVNVYLYPKGNNSAFDQMDTTGWRNWVKPMNDLHVHEKGALNQNLDPNNQWDFSWGIYDAASHQVKGDSLYLFTFAVGASTYFVKFMPIAQEPNGDFIFKYAPLGSPMSVTDTLKQSEANGGSYKYYDLQKMTQVDVEPAGGDWHLNFTRYYVPTFTGTEYIPYLTMGVESKRGLNIAKLENVKWADLLADANTYITDTDTTGGKGFKNDLTRIGSDWKSFNGQSFEVVTDRAYLVEVPNATGADYWGIRFTGFGGTSNGNSILDRVKLGSQANIKKSVLANIIAFPVPASNQLNVIVPEYVKATSYVIRSFDGRILLNSTNSNIDISTLSSGQYILEVSHNLGKSAISFSKI